MPLPIVPAPITPTRLMFSMHESRLLVVSRQLVSS